MRARRMAMLMCLAVSIAIGGSVLGQESDVGKIVLTENGRSDYAIVISSKASPSEKHAAEELQKFLLEISGAKLPVADDTTQFSEKEIILGDNEHLKQTGVAVDFPKLGKEGFTIRTKGKTLIIAGGRLRGTMYGVYTFLEDHLGCRWYSEKVSKIPKMEKIVIGTINDTQIPVLEYRDSFFWYTWDADWSARNKMTGHASRLDATRGGKTEYWPPCHSFNYILNPADHFAEHPEYFSLRDGKRIGEPRTQLCLTNPEVLRITIETVKRWTEEYPDAKIITIEQNDWGNWCECPSCKAIDEREGSPSGTMINFANKVAEAIEKDHPDVAICTFAYQYTRKPPKTLVPRKNVIVRLCSIECRFTQPLEDASIPRNRAFVEDIKRWSKKADRIYIWDYVTNFGNYVMPHPNLDVLQPNIQFFVRHGVKGVFEQGSYGQGGGGEFAELRGYMLAKLLWNPYINVEEVMDDFLNGYYGNAGPYIKRYIKTLHQKVKDENYRKGCGGGPERSFYTQDFLDSCFKIFQEAKKQELSPDEYARVEVAELPIIYVKMVLEPKETLDQKLVDHFFAVAEREGIGRISEGGLMPAFKIQMMTKLGK